MRRSRWWRWQVVLAAATGACALLAASAPAAAAPRTMRVSVSSAGAQDNGVNVAEAISAGGRFVAFASNATDLVPGATSTTQVYLRDRARGQTTLLSKGPSGVEGDRSSGSFAVSMSGDGQVVAFQSSAQNLVPGDRNGAADVFVRDRRAGVTRLVSRGLSGGSANAASDDPFVSADGRFVAFSSLATNLVAGDTNRRGDVFVRDLRTGRIRLVSRSAAGGFANGQSFPVGISRHGRYVAFDSRASDIVAGTALGREVVYVRDMARHTTTRVSPPGAGAPCFGTAMSPDARYVVFDSKAANIVPGDTNHMEDVFVADRAAHTITRVAADTNGRPDIFLRGPLS